MYVYYTSKKKEVFFIQGIQLEKDIRKGTNSTKTIEYKTQRCEIKDAKINIDNQ